MEWLLSVSRTVHDRRDRSVPACLVPWHSSRAPGQEDEETDDVDVGGGQLSQVEDSSSGH